MKPTFYNCPVCKLYYDNDEGRDPGDGQTLEEIAFAYGTDGWEQLPDKPCGCGAFADRFYRIEDRELNTVLAALRYWQRCGDFGGGGIQDIATNGGTEQALESDEIDTLCERLNTQERVGLEIQEICINSVEKET